MTYPDLAVDAENPSRYLTDIEVDTADWDDDSSEKATEGTLLHGVVARCIQAGDTCALAGLDQHQAQAVCDCLSLVQQYADGGYSGTRFVEHSMELLTADRVRISGGTCDLLMLSTAVDGLRGLVVDWKFGRVPVPFAAENLQLAAYALMAHEEWWLDEVEAVVVQPFAPKDSRISSYRFTQFLALRSSLCGVILRASATDAPLVPGSHCRYCKGASRCPAIAGAVVPMLDKHSSAVTDPNEMARFVKMAAVAKVLSKRLDEWASSVEFRARCMILGNTEKDVPPTPIPGVRLKNNGVLRNITDINAAWARACAPNAAVRLSETEFLDACALSWAQLRDLYAKRARQSGAVSNLSDGKDLAMAVFAELITESPRAPSLVIEEG